MTRAETRFLVLDGLRGVAAFGILLYHAHYAAWLDWMATFVDLFFVLSGFVIARLILNAFGSGAFSLKNFMIRRVLRIWPVYYLTLAFCVAVVVLNRVVSGEWERTTGILSAPFFLQFTHHYFSPNFYAGHEEFIVWFHHSWSIAIEEQFYLALPLLLMVMRRRLDTFCIFTAFLIPVALLVRAQGALPILLLSRMDALAIGVLLGLYWFAYEDRGRSLRIVTPTVIAVAGLLGLLLTRVGSGSEPFDAPALRQLGFNVLYGCLLVVALKGWLPFLVRILTSRTLLFLGGVSYALYMFHVPVRGVVLQIFNQGSVPQLPVIGQLGYFTLSILAAYLSKILIENRANRLKARFPVTGAFRKAEENST